MTTPPAPGSPHAARLAELRASLRVLDARSGRISSLRGLTFLAAAGLAAVRFARPVPAALWVAVATLATAFVVLVVAHAVLVTQMSALEVRIRILERGEKRAAGDLAGLPDGARFFRHGHPYAADLDVFGSTSVFQLVSAAETGAGEEQIAHWLTRPADAGEIAARHAAVRELAGMARFREDLATAGVASGTQGRSAEPFLLWAEAGSAGPRPSLLLLGRVLVVLTLFGAGALDLVGIQGAASHLWVLPLVAQLVLLYFLLADLALVLKPTGSAEAPFGRYVELFRLIEAQRFEAPRLQALHHVIQADHASHALGRLQSILGFAEVGRAGIAGVMANMFLLWDVWSAAALIRWRGRYGKNVRRWIAAMAEIEALASLASFAVEHPSYAYPEVGTGALTFVTEGLGHPLIPAGRRVDNDVAFAEPGSALLVTGSNMSGKSTLLRAVGVNAVLALAGAPVCARRLAMTECQVLTSMRIKDSLEEGVSHFYAELARLKTIVDAADAAARVLFLLDEVLHGTNSRERNIGAKAVVTHLIAKGAIGAVSSHDLGLSDLEAQSGGRVKNVHFQELVEDGKMSFDYKLKQGVVTSSNALRLMKLIGLAVDLPDA